MSSKTFNCVFGKIYGMRIMKLSKYNLYIVVFGLFLVIVFGQNIQGDAAAKSTGMISDYDLYDAIPQTTNFPLPQTQSLQTQDLVQPANSWILDECAIVLEYESIYDVHTLPDPCNPNLRSQYGQFQTYDILNYLESMVDPAYYHFVLLYTIQEVPGWINSGFRNIRTPAKNIGLWNFYYDNFIELPQWQNLHSVPHMNSVDFLNRPAPGRPRYGSTLTAIHEIAHQWGVFWARSSPGPRGWQSGDPVAWLASASSHWTWVWLEEDMPGILYSGPTSNYFNAFDLYAMGLMPYDEASQYKHLVYEYDPPIPPAESVTHEVALDDLIYSLSLQGPSYYEGDGLRVPAVDPEMDRLHTLIVVVMETSETITAEQRQWINELADYLPSDWYRATWNRSRMTVDIVRPQLADINNDNAVNFKDFTFFSSRWMHTDCTPPQWCNECDLDQNGTVEMNDLYLLSKYWLWDLK